ncbi:MAG: 2-succinyl-5-enolpyruvyl-6-hydroxy-3-cyclohexene-1-carboxylic-acid synthase [Muribaculaceae bacterium]|nr:2-succinyl-5-enolpyruvyl-6-hydroxy-3-cyclohexene-1-carboxylic-acid synthase [Muribaculaceae bacterium]
MTRESGCCVALTKILAGHGIRHVVVSPGSRNAPLLEAIDHCVDLEATVVIDERSAAFVALGIAQTSGDCVALVCTSGTAVLNYAPALAEAAARHIPLLAITADRPHESIGRNEPQTINQQGVYGSFLKYSFNVDTRDFDSYFDTVVNDAVIAAKVNQSPVHLNIEIADPSVADDIAVQPRDVGIVKYISARQSIPTAVFRDLSRQIVSPKRVMIVAGCGQPSQRLNRVVSRLCSFGNVIAMTDSMANLHGTGIITCIDTVLSGLDRQTLQSLRPDIVITHGGPMLSSYLKQVITDWHCEHWHIGVTDRTVNTFGSSVTRIECDPEEFYAGIVASARRSGCKSDYTEQWLNAAQSAIESAKRFVDGSLWSDLKAAVHVLSKIQRNTNLFLSNGMSVRYAQLLPFSFHRVDCNRGVSGIEGATSTAVGASIVYPHATLLLSGDMSALYDLNALTLNCITSRFKMVVLNNGGGGIFKFIKGTRSCSSVDKCMAVTGEYRLSGLARDYGFKVWQADDESSLAVALHEMLKDTEAPGLLIIETDALQSARVMNQFLSRNRQ